MSRRGGGHRQHVSVPDDGVSVQVVRGSSTLEQNSLQTPFVTLRLSYARRQMKLFDITGESTVSQ